MTQGFAQCSEGFLQIARLETNTIYTQSFFYVLFLFEVWCSNKCKPYWIFKFFKNIWSENLYYNFENCYSNSLKKLFELKFDIWIWNFLFQFLKTLFEFKKIIWIGDFIFKFKKSFDLKIDIWVLNHYFQIQKVVFQFRKSLIDYKHGHLDFEYFYLIMKFDISTLKKKFI